jgi:release factor glutamine methyltransferase
MNALLPVKRKHSLFDRLLQRSYGLIVKPFLDRYLKKERYFGYRKLVLKILPGVFHPAFFFSTRVFAAFIEGLDLKNKVFCEVGAGSGFLSFIAFAKGAAVHSFDINPIAVKGIEENLSHNFETHKGFSAYCSDLFDDVPQRVFDVIIINPPYFFDDPKSNIDYAWYCGKNGEYFEKLFRQLGCYQNDATETYMILAENCELERIAGIAAKYGYRFELVLTRKVRWEQNHIFRIRKMN